jgi:hypothetical protein
MIRRLAPVVALLVAGAAYAQPKGPKIEPTDFKDPGKVTYRFAKGSTETYLVETTTTTKTAVQIAGQDIDVTSKGTLKWLTSLKALDDAVPTKMEVLTEHVKLNQTVESPMFSADITVDDKKVKATSGGQVLVDSSTGETNPMLEQFTQGTEHLGKKAVVLVNPDGRHELKIEGDPAAVKQVKSMPDRSLFPIVWKQAEGLKVGHTWDAESEITTMQQLELLKPIKMKTSYKVLGSAKVDGVTCMEVEFRSTLKVSNFEATAKQSGQDMKLNVASMAWEIQGKAYYDPAKNRPVYATSKGTVEIESTMDMPGAGQGAVKVLVELTSTTTHNAPWK